MSFKINEFLPLTRPLASLRRINQLLQDGLGVVLDLEDSVTDPFVEQSAANLKAIARTGLITVGRRLRPSKALDLIQIRINPVDSPYFADDLASLREWADMGLPLNLMLPKVNSSETAASALREVEVRCKREPTITPLLECPESLRNVEAIIDACHAQGRGVQFGYYDYALSSGIWPFAAYDAKEFWELVEEFARRIESAGAYYLHPPPPIVSDPGKLLQIKAMLLATRTNTVGVASLGKAQTKAFQQQTQARPLNLSPSLAESDLVSHAKKVMQLFEQNRRGQRSFAVIDDRFIPPHELLAAKAYLRFHSDVT